MPELTITSPYVDSRVDAYTVIRFLWVSAKFGTWTVVSVNGTLVEDKMRKIKGECAQFSFNKCPIYTHDGASAKFSTNSQEMDNSVHMYHRQPYARVDLTLYARVDFIPKSGT